MSQFKLQTGSLLGFAAYNVLLVAFLLFSEFDVFDFLVVVYLELCVIGGVSLLRLVVACTFANPFETEIVSVSRSASILFGFLAAGFFVVKFGGLMLALGVALLFLPEVVGAEWVDIRSLHPFVEVCLWALLVRYGVQLIWFTLINKDYREVSILKLLFSPYISGLWVVVTLGVGVFFAARSPGDPGVQFTIGVVLAKVFFDLISLLIELRKDRGLASQPAY